MKKFINDPFDLVDEMLNGFLAVHCKKIRKSEEVTEKWYTKPMAPQDVKVFNPAFDVTASKFITSIITEYGIARPPFKFDSRENLPERSRGKQKSVIPTLQNKTKIWNKTMSPIFHAHE